MRKKYTKIVATISDKRCEVDFIQQLYDDGMNVVRMNSAHLQREGFLKIINNVRTVSNKIALLIDTKGPEVRTTVALDDAIELKTSDLIRITGNPDLTSTKECIAVSYPFFVRDLQVGDDILIDDGEIELKVKEKADDFLTCRVLNDGILGSRKSVNVPGVRINLPSITEKDRHNILFAIEQNLDFIAHSFVRSREDLLDIQKILDEHNSQIKIIAKIENQEGVDNINEILKHCHGVMIARGDLGIEVAQEKIPGIQRRLIRKCVQAKKPVIVATQMLHSMISNPRPTRAEVTDIANAIYYRTDALMLSGETAYGKYPIESVRTMAKIAKEAEMTKMPENDIPIPIENNNVTAFLANAAVEASTKIDIKAIINDSIGGGTSRCLSAYRGDRPVYAFCYYERTMRELALSYGIFPEYRTRSENNTQEYFHQGLQELIKSGLLKADDYICSLSGNFDSGFGTTLLKIDRVDRMLEMLEGFSK